MSDTTNLFSLENQSENETLPPFLSPDKEFSQLFRIPNLKGIVGMIFWAMRPYLLVTGVGIPLLAR